MASLELRPDVPRDLNALDDQRRDVARDVQRVDPGGVGHIGVDEERAMDTGFWGFWTDSLARSACRTGRSYRRSWPTRPALLAVRSLFPAGGMGSTGTPPTVPRRIIRDGSLRPDARLIDITETTICEAESLRGDEAGEADSEPEVLNFTIRRCGS